MGILEQFWNALRSDPDLEGLDDEQNQAVVDALVATVFSDAQLATEEAAEFDRQLQRLPWRWANDARARERVLTSARQKADGLADPDAADALVESIAARLPSPVVREKVYKMCVALSLADQSVHPGETNLLGGLRLGFGIPELRAEAIAGEVRAGLGR